MKFSEPKFFHTLCKDGHINEQGIVLDRKSGRVTVELFSWLTGLPTETQTFDESETKSWIFYFSESAWKQKGNKVFS